MHEAVDSVTSRIGLSIMRELSVHGPRTASELMDALAITRRQTLLRTLNRLETAGVVAADLEPGERRGRQATYRLKPANVRWYFQQLQTFALGNETHEVD